MRHPARFRRLSTAAVAAVALAIPAVLVSGSATASTATVDGPDVASYQHPASAKFPKGKPINWTAVAGDGKEFAIVKATEGTTYVNPYFNGPTATDYDDALAAGLVHGSYHFARPALPVVASAQAQAEYFADTVGAVNTPQTLPPALDLEVTGGLSRAQLVTWAQVFLYHLRVLTGRTPMLYTYPNFWSSVLDDPSAFSRFPLWMASYGTSTAPVADLWQYTDAASVTGISGKVDLSKFIGTSGLPWATLSDGTAKVPWADAVPSKPRSVTVSAGPGTATVSWLPGSDGSARTTSYTVTATPDTSASPTPSPTATPTPTPGVVTARVNGGSNSATVTGLDPNTSYSFSVVATNSVGTSAASAASGAIQPVVASTIAATARHGVGYGTSLKLSATLRQSSTGAAVAGQSVTVYRRPVGGTTWHSRAVVTTDASGVAALTLKPKHSLQVKFGFAGGTGYLPSSAVLTTVVRPVVTAVLAAPKVRHGQRVGLTGTVTPVVAGEQVTLQVLNRKGSWQAQRSKPAVAGRFSFVLRPTSRQPAREYRVVAAAVSGRATGTSPVVRLKVT